MRSRNKTELREGAPSLSAFQALAPACHEAQQPSLFWAPKNPLPPVASKVTDSS